MRLPGRGTGRVKRAHRAIARAVAVAVTALAGLPCAAAAHGPVRPGELWRAWSLEPWVVLPLAAAMLAYAVGLRRLWTRAGDGRGVPQWRAWSFTAGAAVTAVALVSPLDALAGSLFAAHMTQHMLLMGVAAPLLVLGAPLTALTWALPQGGRRMVARAFHARPVSLLRHALGGPLAAWLLHGAAVWLWHLPSLYSATLSSSAVHAAQHASFMGTAVLFWWVLRDRTTHGLAVLYLFTTAVHTSLLGALLAFAPAAYYAPYELTAPLWGLTPLEDQQVGGFIMWVPGGLVYFVAALALLGSWLRQADRRSARARLAMPAAGTALVAALLAGSACGRGDAGPQNVLPGADAERGRAAMASYGCGACHVIPGVRGADGRVGPPLDGVGGRVYIAGMLRNEPDALVRWIMQPSAFRSPTAMPDLGVTEAEARDMAAYLYRLAR